eukprot:m.24966 g.24966  ORF g.24966 m.24966 type:complete len:69 (-) comp8667_c0_seq1:1410-1616(-)
MMCTLSINEVVCMWHVSHDNSRRTFTQISMTSMTYNALTDPVLIPSHLLVARDRSIDPIESPNRNHLV